MPLTHDARGAVIVLAMFIVTVGTANLIAKKYEGHPAADAWLDLFGSGCSTYSK
jgi:hypothetical protein